MRWCETCGTRHVRAFGCPARPVKRGSGPARERQRAFRKRTLEAAGNRCQFIDSDGNRCTATIGLEAAHLQRYADDGNFAGGAALCPLHHRMVDGAPRS
jgi:predicted restriction endonuclease